MKKILFPIILSVCVMTARAQVAPDREQPDTIDGHKELRVRLIYFLGQTRDDRLILKWNVADNESANLFEVEKSYDEQNFMLGGMVFGSEKSGNETYFFPDLLQGEKKTFYRLKMIDKNKKVKYSKILSFQSAPATEKNYVTITRNLVPTLF